MVLHFFSLKRCRIQRNPSWVVVFGANHSLRNEFSPILNSIVFVGENIERAVTFEEEIVVVLVSRPKQHDRSTLCLFAYQFPIIERVRIETCNGDDALTDRYQGDFGPSEFFTTGGSEFLASRNAIT
jgi:hypothetical protein